jgi:hypothetical protein
MLWAEFLENVPPNTEENIEDLFVKTQYGRWCPRRIA